MPTEEPPEVRAAESIEQGNAYLEAEDWSDAEKAFTEAISLDPEAAEAFLGRGLAYKEMHETRKSLEDLDKAISLDTELPSAYLARSQIYWVFLVNGTEFVLDLSPQEILSLVLDNLDHAIALDDKNVEAYVLRGSLLLALEEFDAALADFNQIIALEPEFPLAYARRGFIFEKRGEIEAALQDYDRALMLGLEPDDQKEIAVRVATLRREPQPGDVVSGQMVHMGSYEVMAPTDGVWTSEIGDGDQLVLTRGWPDDGSKVDLSPSWVAQPWDGITAEAVAEDYRAWELDNMFRSVTTAYELTNVEQGEHVVGERLFYYMSYTFVFNEEEAGQALTIDAVLYLYFPEEFAETYAFYRILFSDMYVPGQSHMPLTQGEIDAFLASFVVLE
ncbi:MAG: tetratricopeptide repeat protein [Anaerolineales bacterium]|nr:tetratricopeptide repeat protein [Anaerolineales bacterium]